MAQTVRIEGLRELEKALAQLPKTTGKALLRRVLKKRAMPFDAAWRAMAPIEDGDLKKSGGVGRPLSRAQKSAHKKMFKDDKAAVEIFAGPGTHPQAIAQEFGTGERVQKKTGRETGRVTPHPFARPAWDSTHQAMLNGIAKDLGDEIAKSAARLARKGKL